MKWLMGVIIPMILTFCTNSFLLCSNRLRGGRFSFEGNMRVDRQDIHSDWKVIKERKEDGSYFNMDRDDGMGGRSRVEEASTRPTTTIPTSIQNIISA